MSGDRRARAVVWNFVQCKATDRLGGIGFESFARDVACSDLGSRSDERLVGALEQRIKRHTGRFDWGPESFDFAIFNPKQPY